MSLSKYKQKRSFDQTPEPTGGKVKTGELRFVIQKHDASHLHYDFRLEMEGVLKSWAVPKGPSTDPDVKRLAMMVEDHPYDYRTFEGIIPEGNYGAGTVIVWDEGTYTMIAPDGRDKKEQEKELLKALNKGDLKFALHGKKLKGEFVLVKTKGYSENSWLLIKHNDKYASTKDVTLKDKSVISGERLAEVEQNSTNIYGGSPKKAAAKKTARSVKAAKTVSTEESDTDDTDALLKKAPKAPFPKFTKPMLAMRADKPFDGKGWIYEIKWDGYRALALMNGRHLELLSRNEQSFTDKFETVTDALKAWKVKAVVDGEVIAIKDDGNADFQSLQNFARKGKAAQLAYYVFDLLWYDGKDLTGLPLIERKAILRSIVPEDDSIIRYSDHIEDTGTKFFNAAKKQGLEGIMAKKGDSEYVTGRRTDDWLKIKNDQVMVAIICGFTKGRNSRAHFGAVILGKYIKRKLTYIGHSGSGFNDTELKELGKKFEQLITEDCPFAEVPDTNMPATWLKPELVCEVQFTEWTGENVLRHPIFKGLREDKTAKTERTEKIVEVDKDNDIKQPGKKAKKAAPAKKKVAAKKATIKNETKPTAAKTKGSLLLPVTDESEVTLTINRHPIKFTNLDKLYWPKDGITKRDMLNYYHDVAPYMMPYMKDRPQSLNRYPDGIEGFNFYQKDVKDKVADWITTYRHESESRKEDTYYMVCKDEASLLYMASMGCIEMHPWHSRIQKPDNPDWCVIDLDPDGNKYDQVIEVAQVVKQLLDSAGLPSFVKTSGSTGMHICIPLGAKYSYDQSKLFAELIANIAHNELPRFTSIERATGKRRGKLYIDFLQNRSIQTIAAPYSLRPKPGATASAPLQWDEVKIGLKISDFHIHNMLDRIKDVGDPFKGVLGKGIDLKQAIEQFSGLIK